MSSVLSLRQFLSAPARACLIPAFVCCVALLSASMPANAVPAFARQTGEECASCHIGAFGPQLTPRGMRFKLTAYTDSDGRAGHVPLSGMLVGTFDHTAGKLSENAGPHDGRNDNISMQEASVFLSGKLSEHLGSFIQATYSEISRDAGMDNADIRYARTLRLSGKPLIAGISLNNNPGVAEVSNSVGAWRFPFMASELVPESVASPLIDGGLEGQVLGASAYAMWNDSVYAEFGAYRSLSHSTLDSLNVDDEAGKLSGPAPYWRIGCYKDLHTSSYSLGLFGMNANLHPERAGGPSDKYRDMGIDGQWQYLGNRRNIYTLNASMSDEHTTRDASLRTGAADNLHGDLRRLDINASWFHNQAWGLTAAVFGIRGDRDHTLYGAEPDAGSRKGSPNASGFMLQADWTPFGKEASWHAPWANLRLGIQYTKYDVFNGAGKNYDGFGRDASDNDTLFLFAWTAF